MSKKIIPFLIFLFFSDANAQANEQSELSNLQLNHISAASNTIEQQLQKHRKYDIVKANCISDKLNQIHAVMHLALAKKDKLFVINNLAQRADQLVAESNQCIGVDSYYIVNASTKITTTIDPNLPQQDTSSHTDVWSTSAPPQCVSCIR